MKIDLKGEIQEKFEFEIRARKEETRQTRAVRKTIQIEKKSYENSSENPTNMEEKLLQALD